MKIGLVAGESSGDLLGAGLIREIHRRYPDATFEGVAGPEMLAAGCTQWEPSESLAVMGLIEPLAHLPRLLRLRKSLIARWRTDPPDVFVGIDAPDFNLGLEKRLRRSGIKTVHYVSPSIWAWRAGRVKTVKKAADKVLCLLPFEPSLYETHGVAAEFVGHPKADSVPAVANIETARETLGIDATSVIAVLPGSRKTEIDMLGSTLFDACHRILAQRPETQFVTPVATPALRSAIEEQVAASGLSQHVQLLAGDSETAMMAADIVLLASGTAALESALLGKPTIAAYRLGGLTYAILSAFRLLKLSHFTLPNLLTETPLVPEFMQDNARADLIAAEVIAMLDDAPRRHMIADRFAKLRAELAIDTNQKAADAVIALALN